MKKVGKILLLCLLLGILVSPVAALFAAVFRRTHSDD